ncbi:hypothetical protein Misp01_60740 [Microtetraspora sp. NBRC 13810]|uniref:hypothetical protein n=1 Tax=Microtetraspora sp. NBRC 13810 TaxID=3030990 RepID=UPI0024A43358|nr:hypothetical protein [Microtetraspora sp. NBRC 13810]GLW10946.1 hypothetical protein Misp01_60740 [Microtetraspora sp. NBRC 13810]
MSDQPTPRPLVALARRTTAIAHLTRLAVLLKDRGLEAGVKADGRMPHLVVTNPGARQLTETIYAGPGFADVWRFWWSWHEPIDTVDDDREAAERIARVLSFAEQRR